MSKENKLLDELCHSVLMAQIRGFSLSDIRLFFEKINEIKRLIVEAKGRHGISAGMVARLKAVAARENPNPMGVDYFCGLAEGERLTAKAVLRDMVAR